MKKYLTFLIAIDNTYGKLGKWVGPVIEANSKDDAENWCKENTPYLFVDREVLTISDLDVKTSLFINKN